MINIEELRNEHQVIAESIIATIKGEQREIPYFEYLGSFKERNSIMRARKGLYIFTMLEDVELSPEVIRRYNSATNVDHSLVCAGFKNEYLEGLKKGDVFYLGKVSGETDSIYQRLKVHFGDKTDSATNGIKMMMDERKFIKDKVEVHIFALEKQYEEVRMVLIDPVEKILHHLLNPATGSSR